MRVALVPFARSKLREGGRQRVYGVVGQLRIGHVALHAVNDEPAGQRATTPNFNRVAAVLFAGRLTNHTPVDPRAQGQEMLDNAPRAVDRGPFFVARNEKRDRSLVPGVTAHEVFRRSDHRGKPALHVGRTAAEQVTVSLGRRERIA